MIKTFLKISSGSFIALSSVYYYNFRKEYGREIHNDYMDTQIDEYTINDYINMLIKINKRNEINHIKELFNINGSDDEVLEEYNKIQNMILNYKENNTKENIELKYKEHNTKENTVLKYKEQNTKENDCCGGLLKLVAYGPKELYHIGEKPPTNIGYNERMEVNKINKFFD